MTQVINQEVSVSAFYFAGNNGSKTFPRRIEWNGQPITFAQTGLRYLVKQGSQLVQLFDMTEGNTTYRLRRSGSNWTLVGTKAGN